MVEGVNWNGDFAGAAFALFSVSFFSSESFKPFAGVDRCWKRFGAGLGDEAANGEDTGAVVEAGAAEVGVPKLVDVPKLVFGVGALPKRDGFAAALVPLSSGEVCIDSPPPPDVA